MKKTALVLSGGGSRGAYEIGVWEALIELGIKIDLVTGTSVGSINGAFVAQKDFRLAKELWQEIETDMIFDIEKQEFAFKEAFDRLDIGSMPIDEALGYAREIFIHGGAATQGLLSMLDRYLDESRIRASSVDFGLVVTEFPSMEASFLFSDDIPHGMLSRYILASASCFPAARKCSIGDKQYIDGGYRDNLPVEMAVNRGATHIIAVDLPAAGIIRKSTIDDAIRNCEEFHMIKSAVDLGSFLVFDRANSERIMRLGYLDTMRHFGKYDGTRYTFQKGAFSRHRLMGADNAASILKMDPCLVYSEETFIQKARQAIADCSSGKGSASMHAGNPELRMHLMLHIAGSLRDEKEKSVFLQPAVMRPLMAEVQAANFLVNAGLV